jgi:hypothetical protein
MNVKTGSELGPQIALYRERPFQQRYLLVLFFLLGLAVLVPLGYGLYRAWHAYAHFGIAAASSWSRPWYLISLTALTLLILLAIFFVRQAHRFVAVHKHGLRLALPRPISLRWEQIAGIAIGVRQDRFIGFSVRTSYQAILYPNAGKPIRLDSSLENLPELLTRLKAGLYPRLLPNLRASFLGGQWLHFGPVAIHCESIHIQKRSGSIYRTPWSGVRQITVRSGILIVELENKPDIRLPASLIPNLELLLQLIQQGVTV